MLFTYKVEYEEIFYMKNIPLLLDKPIKEQDNDKFGHRHYAEIIYSLLISPNYVPPFNIGLLGTWGVGKSSIKEICQKKLKKRDDVYCIDFDAWKYGSEGVKRALLKHLYINLGGNYQNFLDEVSRQIEKESKLFESNEKIIETIRNAVNTPISVILASTTIIFIIINTILSYFTAPSWIFGVTNTGISIILSLCIALFKNIPFFQNINKIDLPKASAEEFEELLKEQVKKFKNPETIKEYVEKSKLLDFIKKLNLNIKNDFKIVIFVDDLDRLSSKEMVEGINAVRSFMDLKLPSGVGIIFVLSCCEYKIAEALKSINNYNYSDNIDKKIEAKRFLDKIFQFRVDVPPFPYQDMVEYAKHIMGNQMGQEYAEFEKELQEKGLNVENLLCRLIHPKVQNPRQAIQIVNTFLQSWYIAKERETATEEQIGGLSKGAVTYHPLTLAILSVLKVDFPYFYQFLQQEPNLLRFLIDKVNNNDQTVIIDKKIEQEFIKYPPHTNRSIVNDDSYFKIKSEYYELESYLKSFSLIVEIADSLKPFLLLNQDPLSRKFGDDANKIEMALSYRRTNEIILLFKLNESKLTQNQAKRLNRISEEIREEYKENAYRVIIDLTEYLTEETNFILNPIINYINKNNSFKQKLTVEEYKKILNSMTPYKQDSVLKNIKNRFLSSQKYSLPAENDQENLFEKDSEIKETVAKILLEFYSQHRNKKDLEFFSWVINPYIGDWVEDAPDKIEKLYLDFNFIDSCINEFEFLFDYIGKEYSEKLLSEIEKPLNKKDPNKNIDFTISLKNVEKYLNLIINSDQKKLQEIIKNYISSKNLISFEFGFNYLKNNFDKFDNNVKSFCLIHLINKISSEITKKLIYKDNIPQDIVIFAFEQTKQMFDSFEEKTLEGLNGLVKLKEFIKTLCLTDTFIEQGLDLFQLLELKDKNTEDLRNTFIITSYTDAKESVHKNKLRVYLSNNFNKLTKKEKEQIVKKIEGQILLQAASIPDLNINLFKNFINNLSQNDLKLEFINNAESLAYLFDKIYDHFLKIIIPNGPSGYIDYFKQLFPTVKSFFKYTNNQKLSQMLSQLCIEANYQQSTFNQMKNIWKDLPKEIWKGNQYAQQIFDYTVQNNNNLNFFLTGVEIFDAVKSMQTDTNYKHIFNRAFALRANIVEISTILTKYNKNFFTAEEIAKLGTTVTIDNQEKGASLKNLWRHFIKKLNEKELAEISQVILGQSDILKFQIWGECLKEVTSSTEILVSTIENLVDNNLAHFIQLIDSPHSNDLANVFYGDERKEPAMLLISKIHAIEDDNYARKIASWAQNLYNDIMKFVDIKEFENDERTLNILKEAFPYEKKLKMKGKNENIETSPDFIE